MNAAYNKYIVTSMYSCGGNLKKKKKDHDILDFLSFRNAQVEKLWYLFSRREAAQKTMWKPPGYKSVRGEN